MTLFLSGVDGLQRLEWDCNTIMIISTDTYTVDYDIINDTNVTDIYNTTQYIYIHTIRVDDNHRGKGIANNVLTELQKKHGMHIMLLCFETLKPFYEHIGFYVYELCEDDYYTMKRDYKK